MSKSTKLTCEQRLFITWYLKVCFVGVGEGSLCNIVGNPRDHAPILYPHRVLPTMIMWNHTSHNSRKNYNDDFQIY